MSDSDSAVVGLEAQPSHHLLPSVKELITENLEWDTSDIQQQLNEVFTHFPSLAGETIYVGVTHSEISYHGKPFAMADPYNRIIYMSDKSLLEYQTLFHELTHIKIHLENETGADHPITSEPYCSILAVSKMPADMVYRDHIAYLGEPEVPNEKYPKICQRALEYREDHRNYIQKAKEWLGIND